MANALIIDLQDSTDEMKSVSATLYLSAFCDIDTTLASEITSGIVDAKYALFDVNPVYIYLGVPVAHTDKGVIATMGSGFVAGSYSRGGAPGLEDGLSAVSRWIASSESISTVSGTNQTSWYPVSGSDRTNVLSTDDGDGNARQFPNKYFQDYTYLNGNKYVVSPAGSGAIQVNSDTYLTIDSANFTTGVHTYIAVVVVRAYDSTPVPIITVANPFGELDAPSRTFSSVQYKSEGRVGLYYDNNPYPVSSVKVIDRGLSQARPIIVYLSINTQESSVRYGTISSSSLSRTHELKHEYSGNVYFGGSPYSDSEGYTVDFLDVLYTRQKDIASSLARLDYLYGVTV